MSETSPPEPSVKPAKRPPSRSREASREADLFRKLRELWQRGQSEWCEVRDSGIHGRGVYASRDIPVETQIIEYVGERIGKRESERRANARLEQSQSDGGAAVYIFTLNTRHDLDGDVPWNNARLINHSCDPNCEAWIRGTRIFIHALRNIAAGEELTFDYGFDVDCHEEHPCRCGSPQCVGHIVSRAQWPELRRLLAEKQAATPPAAGAG